MNEHILQLIQQLTVASASEPPENAVTNSGEAVTNSDEPVTHSG